MIPEFNIDVSRPIEEYREPSLTYKVNENEIVTTIDGIGSIEQAIWHILNTERYSNPIYPDDYGVQLERYKSQPFEYLKATIEVTLREALTQDDRIEDIEIINVEKLGVDSALVEFNVFTVKGVLKEKLYV